MQYKGKLYGKVGGSLIPLVHTTDDFDRMEKEISELKAKVEKPLPTDKQIEQRAKELYPSTQVKPTEKSWRYLLSVRGRYIDGAKWMRDLMKKEETK